MSSSNTARLIIEGAVRLIKGPAYNPDLSELGAGFTALNDLLGSWSADRIMVVAAVSENFTLTVGQSSYTVGAGGDFNTVRPTKILPGVYIRDNVNGDHPVELVTRERYSAIAKKDINSRPSIVYYDPIYPLGIMCFDTEPITAEAVYFDSLKPVTEITDLSATLVFPPEYKKALKYNLALELAPEYADIKIPELVLKGAEESKSAVARVNSQPLEPVTFDSILLPTNHFNANTFNSG